MNPHHHPTVEERLMRIETKLDAALTTLGSQAKDQEERLRKVEGRQHALFGGGGIVAAILAILPFAKDWVNGS